VDLAAINAVTLATIDVFVSSWWRDTESAASEAAIQTFFLGGGDLVLLNDAPDRDGIAELLGIPTITTTVNPNSGGATLFDGPFGTVAPVNQLGQVGHLTAADVTANGGFSCGTNALGQVTIACWNPGAYAPGAGAMIIAADVDLISAGGGAVFAPLNDKGTLALNIFAFVPEPGTGLLVGLGLTALATHRRRR